MKLTIFAATGGVGRHALQQALAAGHEVTAVVRNPGKLTGTPARIIAADLTAPDPATLAAAVEGSDAVLSCFGPPRPSEAGIVTPGTRAIVEAMRETDARRVIIISASPIGTVPSPGIPHPPKHDPGDAFFARRFVAPLFRTLLRKHYADLALTEDLLRDSGLDWTAVRPPWLRNSPLTGTYRTEYGQNVRGGSKISRADVAHCMLRAAEDRQAVKQTIGIAY